MTVKWRIEIEYLFSGSEKEVSADVAALIRDKFDSSIQCERQNVRVTPLFGNDGRNGLAFDVTVISSVASAAFLAIIEAADICVRGAIMGYRDALPTRMWVERLDPGRGTQN